MKEKEKKISHLKQNLSTMSDEIKGNVKETRKALKEKKRLEMSLKRKDKILNEVLEKNNELRDVIEDESSIKSLQNVTEGKNDSTSLLKVKRESFVGRKGGGHRWPVRVVQLICELLVDGAPPSSIPRIIYTTSSTMTNEEPKDLPSVNFVRGCRIIAQIIGETIAAIKLARSESWEQLFTDGTSRRQVSFQNMIIGLLSNQNDTLHPLHVSSCIFNEDETSEKQVEGMIEKVRNQLNNISTSNVN